MTKCIVVGREPATLLAHLAEEDVAGEGIMIGPAEDALLLIDLPPADLFFQGSVMIGDSFQTFDPQDMVAEDLLLAAQTVLPENRHREPIPKPPQKFSKLKPNHTSPTTRRIRCSSRSR